ncbi:TPA: ATP-binding protein [Escherichia albertii]|uniref:AAA family ATPase n=2 Tax=Escherichia albertii TaxID=208962 RepID=UPI000C802CA4|nr:ATP-binding protein [Escherichia albertii]MCV3219478.1 ATP-binding protein [Escherichia albertii]MCV3236872.1 ATP-binding protein [Escherichia albertii]MCV3245526.1 ATP-binding protein [Escherichia albertii]MCV3260456.1 ATP-binding protein [Escherichia albertii]MCW3803371.1 ATP-binding protein [Escherichia albertii]
MSKIDTIFIEKMWGYKNVHLQLNESINFLIGVNGSGKTTIINIMSNALSVDVAQLLAMPFSELAILFTNGEMIRVEKKSKTNVEFVINYKDSIFTFNLEDDEYNYVMAQRIDEAKSIISKFLTMDFLPLSRAGNKEYEHDPFSDSPSDPVNNKLDIIKNELVSRFSRQSKIYNKIASNFQRDIFNKLLEVPGENELRFFNDYSNLDKEEASLREISNFMSPQKDGGSNKKLENYFQKLRGVMSSFERNENNFSVTDLGIMFNAWRTSSLIADYENLKKKKNDIFRTQNEFFEVFKLFFPKEKEIILSSQNQLVMKTENGHVSLNELSSGEKQMIILLGQIYLSESKPVLYIADEPEVSLHVKWQDKIVDALMKINPNAQFLLATHSPDVIGRRRDFALKV